MSFRSDELYRSVAMPAAPRADVRGANQQQLGGSMVAGDAKSTMLSMSKTAGVAEAPLCRGPLLPVDLAKFPKQPLYAILKGSYSSCFETVKGALSDLQVVVEKANMEKGKFKCSLSGQKESRFVV